ncbi:MAG: hypothetical protein ABIS92_08105 [Polyangia bacterium]
MTTLRRILTVTAAFAIAEAGWFAWLLSGFSTGGIAVVVERAVTRLRESEGVRTWFARLLRRQAPMRHEPARSLALSGSW